MIHIIDFVPKIEKKGGLFKPNKIQEFKQVLAEMNVWVENNEQQYEIVQIETIVLPNIHDPSEEGSEDTELWTGTSSTSSWHQLIRVWYKIKK